MPVFGRPLFFLVTDIDAVIIICYQIIASRASGFNTCPALTQATGKAMAQAESAHTTSAPALSRPATGVSQANPSIDRAALMRRAHAIARQARPHMPSYRAAFSYGLKAAWGLLATRREFAAVRARVQPRVLTADQRAASERTTRRCGASYMPF